MSKQYFCGGNRILENTFFNAFIKHLDLLRTRQCLECISEIISWRYSRAVKGGRRNLSVAIFENVKKTQLLQKLKNWNAFIFCKNDAALLKLTYFVKLNCYYKICRFQLHRCIARQLILGLFFPAPSCTTCFCTWNLFGRHSGLQWFESSKGRFLGLSNALEPIKWVVGRGEALWGAYEYVQTHRRLHHDSTSSCVAGSSKWSTLLPCFCIILNFSFFLLLFSE